MCSVKSGYILGRFTPLLETQVMEGNSIRPRRVVQNHLDSLLVRYTMSMRRALRNNFVLVPGEKDGTKLERVARVLLFSNMSARNGREPGSFSFIQFM